MYEAPFGVVLQETVSNTGLRRHDPEITFLFLQWQDAHPAFSESTLLADAAAYGDLVDAAVGRVADLLAAVRATVSGMIVLSFLPRMSDDLGLFAPMAAHAIPGAKRDAKVRLAARMRDSLPSTYLFDLDEIVAEIGRRNAFDLRLWYGGRFPFSVAGAQIVAARMMAYAVLLRAPRAKVIAVDADNTLWGGVIGEDGIDGISLSPEWPGRVYVDFQKRLLEFRERGFLLALVSKNNPEDVRHVLSDHPHMVLKDEHFAAMRVNWNPKPNNLREIAGELNLGLDSFVFVDDSPYECLAVRQGIPEVAVVRVPEDLLAIPRCLDGEPRLEVLGLTEEDRERTALYAQERKRHDLALSTASVDEYLASLAMAMTVRIDPREHAPRIAQLTQKTNQFNLTTRRYSEADVRRFMDAPEWLAFDFSLLDVFGDSGIVGVALVERCDDARARIDTFLMSCRVIGRKAETAFLGAVLDHLSAAGVRHVAAEYLPTKKNALAARFWADSGFTDRGAGQWELALDGEWRSPFAGLPIEMVADAIATGA